MIAVTRLVAIAIVVLALQGCTRYIALTRADSVAPISKVEPITVTFPDGASKEYTEVGRAAANERCTTTPA